LNRANAGKTQPANPVLAGFFVPILPKNPEKNQSTKFFEFF